MITHCFSTSMLLSMRSKCNFKRLVGPWQALRAKSTSSTSLFTISRHMIKPNSPNHSLHHSRLVSLAVNATSQQTSSQYTGAPSQPIASRMILTDAMALLYRSHFAFSAENRLRNTKGDDTTVLFGFISMLLNLLELQPSPTHFVVVFDAKGKTFRHELYPGYKGQRPDAPDEVRAAVPALLQLLPAMGVPALQVPGVEADDAIGTLALRGVKEGMAVAIASPDKDFFQILQPGVVLLRPPKKTKDGQRVSKYALQPYTEDHFREEWHLSPSQFIDLLALAGDSSDNVPGVAGIGPKIATNLLQEFGDLENILKRAEEVKGKRTREALETGAAAAMLSQQLVSIRTDLDMPPVLVPFQELRLRAPADGGAQAFKILRELEFNKHITRLQKLWSV